MQGFLRAFGPRGLVFAATAKLRHPPVEVSVTPRGLPSPVRLRLDTSDVVAYEHIFVNGEYRFDFAADVRVVVDAGAHVGLAAAYFAASWPQAKVVALEPDRENFSLLAKTMIRGYQRVIPVNAALWGTECALHVTDVGMGNWAYRTQEATGVAPEGSRGIVRGMTVPGLMARFGFEFVDVLKIDIEGAEKEIFDPTPDWLDRVGAIVIELHDRWKPGCSEAFYAAVRHEFPFEYHRGEDVVVSRYAVRGAPYARRAREPS